MTVREEIVLQPRKASIKNPNDWPQFDLKQVTITSLKTGQNASLLSASEDNPLTVCGKLTPIDDDHIQFVRDKGHIRDYLNVDCVTLYSFAEYDDSTYGFWAAGKAGWFGIQSPAVSFRATYEQMNEAASIFYMLADRWRRSSRSGSTLDHKGLRRFATKIFHDYTAQRKDPSNPSDINEARAIFHKHKDFLITSMLEGQDELDWTQAPILHYFKMMFPDEFAAIEAKVLRPLSAAQDKTKIISKDGRDSSRKRKSHSPQEDSNHKRKHKRKAAQQAESRIQSLPKGLVPKTPQSKDLDGLHSSEEDNNVNNLDDIVRKQKSILQPSGGKYSKKAAARRKQLGLRQEDDNDEGEAVQLEDSPIITLRTARDLEILTNPPANLSSPEPTPSPKFLPRKYLELKVIRYDLPSTDPQGPGDLWTCTFEGCFHRVQEASTSEGKGRIKEHFKTHASSAQEKIDLVLNESRPYLPVNNLVRRLQAFAPIPDTEPEPDSLSRKFSPPIRRRY